MEKILIIQTAFIGDAILASAMLEQVHQERPNAEIHLLIRKGNEVLFGDHPFLKKLWIWDKKEKYKSLFALLPQVRKQRFDWLFCIQRFGTMGWFTAFSAAQKKVGFKKNPWSRFFNHRIPHEIGSGKHEIERNLTLLHPWLGKNLKAVKPKLYPTPAHFAEVSPYQEKPYLCLFPTSVWFTKQLPPNKWVELIDKHWKYQIYLLGAPTDKNDCLEIAKTAKHENINVLCGKLNLMESLALMKNASRNYVNDSAPMHLASAVNAPVTAFFCSTIPSFGFGPLSEDSQVIEIEGKLPCRPCGLHGKNSCPAGHFKCGNEIIV